jgi:hypothetical protein
MDGRIFSCLSLSSVLPEVFKIGWSEAGTVMMNGGRMMRQAVHTGGKDSGSIFKT